MATPILDYEQVGRVLAHAYFLGKPQACEKYGVATRTFERYVSIRKDDEKLAALYDQGVNEITRRHWAGELSETLTVSLQRIGTELQAVKVEGLDDAQKLVFLTKELMELEMSRMYAEADTRDDSDAYAGQRQSSSREASGQAAQTITN